MTDGELNAFWRALEAKDMTTYVDSSADILDGIGSEIAAALIEYGWRPPAVEQEG